MHAGQPIETFSIISLRKYTYEALKRLDNENPSNECHILFLSYSVFKLCS